MNSTGRWLVRIGAAVILIGFFLPAVSVSGTANLGFIGRFFGVGDLPDLTVPLPSPTLGEIAARGSGLEYLLYLIPLAALALIILSFFQGLDSEQDGNLLNGQAAALLVGALAAVLYLVAAPSQNHSFLFGLITVKASPAIGIFVLILGFGVAGAGIVTEYSERGAQGYGHLPPSSPRPTVWAPPRRPRRTPGPAARFAPAWLISRNGREHQLRQGLTTLGRSSRNDIVLPDDPTMSREHAKIMEEAGHYRLVDLGGPGGTRVNGQRVHGKVVLASNDELQFGKNTIVRFVTARR